MLTLLRFITFALISITAWGGTSTSRYTEEEKAKQALLEVKEREAAEERRKTALWEIQRQYQRIAKYKTLDAEFSDSLRAYDRIALKYRRFEERLSNLKDPDAVMAALMRCEMHECADLADLLSRERTKNEILKKFGELHQKLAGVKESLGPKLSTKDLGTVSLLVDRLSEIKKSLADAAPCLVCADPYGESLAIAREEAVRKLLNLWNENRPGIHELRIDLSKMNDSSAVDAGSALKVFTILINTFEAVSVTVSTTAPSTQHALAVPVLYIHWAGTSFPEIGDRAELDEGLGRIREAIRQFSYGQVTIDFTVCEAQGGAYPEENLFTAYDEAVRLCDPQIDYVGADGEGPPLLFFYPIHGGAKTYFDRQFDSDEGEFRTNTASPGWGRNGLHNGVAIHETGHAAWDLNHAASLECDSLVYGGRTCREGHEYGDYFDTMGMNRGHFNAKYKERLGWIAPTAYSPAQSAYLLRPLESVGTGDVALKLPIDNSLTDGVFEHHDPRIHEPCDDLYIEYRRPIEGDADAERLNEYIAAGLVDSAGGLALHCATSEGGGQSWLLDCSPESRTPHSHDMRDALVRPGERCDVSRLGYIVGFHGVTADNRAQVEVLPSCEGGGGLPEECDDIDNDCDGTVDEGCDDDDGDWYCNASLTIFGRPSICRRGGGDCDDNNAFIHPGGVEYCDGHDNDCDGSVDEGGVCPEVCDGADNDGDGATDEGCNQDGDAYCGAGMPVVGLPAVCPAGGGDCNDSDVSIHPAAAEICDGIDNNCIMSPDGVWVDEGGVCPAVSCTDSDRGYNPTVGGSTTTSTGGPAPVTETLSDFCEEGGWVLTEYVCMPVLGGGSRGLPVSGGCPSGLWCINPGGGLPGYCGEE